MDKDSAQYPTLTARQIAELRSIFNGDEMPNVRVLNSEEEIREAIEEAREAWERVYRSTHAGQAPSAEELAKWYGRHATN